MSSAISVIMVVLCVSIAEGLWAWLLASAIAEVAGQGSPSLVAIALVLFVAWFIARLLTLMKVSTELRRWVLIGGGLGLALIAGSIQGGVLLPVQLILGHYTPDLRGAGIVLLLLVAYLWGRGLALARDVNRDRVIGHIAASTVALVLILLFLPLTSTVHGIGLGAVIGCFAFGAIALLLVQTLGVETHELTASRWAMIAGGSVASVILCGAALTGVLSSGRTDQLGRLIGAFGRRLTPITNAVLLALGHVTEVLALTLRWLTQVFAVEKPSLVESARNAEEARPKFEQGVPQDAPALLAVIVAVFLTAFFAALAILIFHRLVGSTAEGEDDDVEEARLRLGQSRDWRGLFSRLPRFGLSADELEGEDRRTAIRRVYRRFQVQMARAGLPRQPDETPKEYEHALAHLIPTVSQELSDIAEAYNLARYSGPNVSLPSADAIRDALDRIRSALADAPALRRQPRGG